MTEPIKLPPLPYPIAYAIAASNTGLWVKAILAVDAKYAGVDLMDQRYVGRLITTDQAEVYARASIEPYRKALHDLIRDLEMRSNLKEGRQNGVVDCGNGVYRQALIALGEIE